MLVEDVLRLAARRDACFLINHRSGRSALRLDGRSVLNQDGIACPRYEILRPLRRQRIDRDAFADTSWTVTTAAAFTSAWKAEIDELIASTSTETMHLVTGLLLPIWDALPDELAQVVRVVDDAGQSLLGRQIPTLAIPELAKRFGFDAPLIDADDLVRAVLDGGRIMPVRAGHPLRRRIAAARAHGLRAGALAGAEGTGLLRRDHPLPDQTLRARAARIEDRGRAGILRSARRSTSRPLSPS